VLSHTLDQRSCKELASRERTSTTQPIRAMQVGFEALKSCLREAAAEREKEKVISSRHDATVQ